MRARRLQSRRGNSLLEFTLICIPLIFVLISIVEISRYMWTYHTLAFSVKRGARFAIVHGKNCADASASCPTTIGALAQVVRNAATGLDPAQLNVILQSGGNTQNCNPLTDCLGNTAAWPPAPDNNVGLPVTISGTYPFRSAMSIFWPGAGSVKFAKVNVGAKAREEIRF